MADYTLTKTGAQIDAIHTKVDGIEAAAEVNPTDAETKTAYENNADTNAFTDAEQTKVGYVTVTGAVDLDTAVVSDPTGVTGADAVTNIISLTQAEYDAIGTPDSATLYFITDAS